ncbi:MAG: ABC transporter permease, partial [Gemmatimonadota bacterium]
RMWLQLLPAHVRDEHSRELRDDLLGARPSVLAIAADILRASPGAHWDVLRQDMRLALRQLRRDKAFALIAGLTLATGIGGNVAFFSLVDGVLLQPLPLIEPHRLVDITEENISRNMRNFGVSAANFRDLTRGELFQSAALYQSRSATLTIGETKERMSFAAVSGDFFRVFAEAPLIGRTLVRQDDVVGNADVVVSYDFWRRVLGGDTQAVGREIDVDGRLLRVVGVMPQRFTFPSTTTSFWRSLAMSEAEWQRRGARFAGVVARLRPAVTVEHAQAALSQTALDLEKQYPRTNTGWTVKVWELRDSIVSGVRTPLLLIWGAGALVLIIAISNVASLFTARAVTREREVALRAALGARLGRLVRQLATEAAMLVTLSAAAGVAFASAIIAWIRPLALSFVPRMQDVTIGPRILAYAALLLFLTIGLLGLLATAPLRSNTLWTSLGSSRASASPVLRRRRRRIVVAEVALAVFALVGSALVVRTLAQLLSQPKGFDPNNLLTFRIEPPFRFALDGPVEQVYRSMTEDRRRIDAAFQDLTQQLE